MSKPTAPKPATPPAPASAPASAPAEPQQPITYRSEYPAIVYPNAPGGPIQFENGEYTTDDPERIAYLDERNTATRAA